MYNTLFISELCCKVVLVVISVQRLTSYARSTNVIIILNWFVGFDALMHQGGWPSWSSFPGSIQAMFFELACNGGLIDTECSGHASLISMQLQGLGQHFLFKGIHCLLK